MRNSRVLETIRSGRPAFGVSRHLGSPVSFDMMMLGPADFSILAGIPGQLDHELIERAVETVAQAAKNAGKNWAATSGSIAQAERFAGEQRGESSGRQNLEVAP